MKGKARKKWIWGTSAAVAVALAAWIAWGNTALELNVYTVSSGRLPEAFDGYRIAMVSDLHSARFGKDNQKLLEMLRQAEPDLIALTGDLVDRRRLEIPVALAFVREAVKIAPCYYVMGNHEGKLPGETRTELELALAEMGVTLLHDRTVTVEKEDQSICVAGIDDPVYARKYGGIGKTMDSKLLRGMAPQGAYTVLLAHRPIYFDAYVEAEMDLVLSGHMHGGQFRVPFLGGLYGPSYGFFPEYDAGMYARENTVMLVSRGLGNSLFPFRVNNRPEVVIVELKRSE